MVPDGAIFMVGSVALLAGSVAVALAIFALGSLRRSAKRVAGQVREIRRHPEVGELTPESETGLKTLGVELNHLLGDLRARLRQAAARSGDLLALMDAPSDLALVALDGEWQITAFGRGAVAVTGWPREEMLGRHVEILFAPGSWETILPKLARRSLREAGIAERVRLQRRDGELFPALISLAPAPEGRAATAGFLLVARDLTAERALETRLRESEERHRRLVEGVGDGVFILQGERLVYVNPALARIVAIEREALQGRPFKDLLEAGDLLRTMDIVRRAERGEEGGAGEIACRLKGEAGGAPLEARVAWSRTEFGGRPALIGTVADLTARARLEQVIAASEARLQAILMSTADGILVLGVSSRGGSVVLANRAFCEQFGLPAEDMPGLSEAELAGRLQARVADPARILSFLEEASRPGASPRLEGLEVTVPRRALLDLATGPVRAASGEILGLLFTSRDVTVRLDLEGNLRQGMDDLGRAKSELEGAYRELAEAQKSLAQRNEQLERLNAELKSLDEMKSNLLANVSHELHTPLVSIKGYTEMILKRRLGPLTPEQERGLSVALKNIDRLVEMIDNLLSFSRMEKGETQLHLEDIPLWQVVDEAVEMVGERIKKKNIAVTTEYETDDLMMRGDRTKIGQVLTNLLTNAVKFNKEGGGITIRARKGPRGFLEMEVADTGIGIPAEEQGKIFERFYQVDGSSRRKYEGTGIGLSIVRDILRLHGGSIRVSSEPGQGSVFIFTLPLARVQAGSAARPPAGRGRARE